MRFINLIFLLSFALNCFAQPNLDWVNKISTSREEYNGVIKVDIDGYAYIGGMSVQSDNSIPPQYNYDLIIRKLDSSGNTVWNKFINGSMTIRDMDIDSLGNIYIIGHFWDTVDFDPSINEFNLISEGGSDIYVLKLNNNGEFVWSFSMGSYQMDYGNSIELNNNGFLYLTGAFAGPVDFDPGVNTFYMVAPYGGNIFIQKIDTLGNLVWAKSISSSTSFGEGKSITVDENGFSYITGVFGSPSFLIIDTVDFDPGAGTNFLIANRQSIFVLKLDPNGNFVWANNINSTGAFSVGESISIDNNEDIIVSGHFQDTLIVPTDIDTIIVINPSFSERNAIIFKVSKFGNFKWAKSLSTSVYSYAYTSVVDDDRFIYTTGYFNASAAYPIDFNPGILTSPNEDGGLYIHKMDEDGNFIWVKTYNGDGFLNSNSLFLDQDKNIYNIGSYSASTIDVDPSANIYTISNYGNNKPDLVYFKWDQCLSDITVIDTTITDTAYITPSGNDTLIYSGTYIDILPNASQNGCDSLIKINLISNIVGINEILNTTEVESVIYPNPTSSQLTIVADLDIHEINIHDITGKLIKRIIHNTNNINVADLSNGVYFIKLVTDEGIITKKFVKQ